MTNLAPCKGCEKREIGCHSKCEDYKAFLEMRRRIVDEHRKATNEWNVKLPPKKYLKWWEK